jgi:hypothetical protein
MERIAVLSRFLNPQAHEHRGDRHLERALVRVDGTGEAAVERGHLGGRNRCENVVGHGLLPAFPCRSGAPG